MKKNILAIAALLVLGVLAWFFAREAPETEKQEQKVVLPFPMDVNRIDKFNILRHEGSGSTLREEFIELRKQNGEWYLTEPVAYKAHQQLIELMLEELGGVKVIDAITDDPKKHRALEVDDDFGVVVTAFEGTEEILKFIVGVTQKDITFVRVPGADTVYRTTGAYRRRFNKSTSQLRHKPLMELDEKSVTRMKYINGKGTFETVRTGEGEAITFEPVGVRIKNFDDKKAISNADAILRLIAKDFVDGKPGDEVTGLGPDAEVVEFDASKKGEKGTFKIWIGKEVEKMNYTHVKTSLSDQIFLVSDHLLSRFRVSAEDFSLTDEEVQRRKEHPTHGPGHTHGQAGHSHGPVDGDQH